MSNKRFDIYERAFTFATRSAKFIREFSKDMILMEYSKQLIRSSSSIGANLEEADGALTRKDFINRMGIARREARESHHWLRLIESVGNLEKSKDLDEIKWLVNESKEILLILSAIINKTKT